MPPPNRRPPSKKPLDLGILVRRINREVIAKFGLPQGSMPADPLDFLLRIGAGVWPADITDRQVAGSQHDLKDKEVPMELRMEAAKISARYYRPQLSAQEVSGPDGGPIPIAAAVINMNELMKDPAMRASIERLSLEMSTRRRQAMLEARATLPVIDTTAETVLDDEDEVTQNGNASDERSDPDNPGEDGQ